MSKFLSIFAVFVCAACFAQGPVAHAPYQVVPAPRAVTPYPVYQLPTTLWVPRVQYVPYEYKESRIWERQYNTPLRNLLFGRYRMDHIYAPKQ